jgi:Uma2 family endonuclease
MQHGAAPKMTYDDFMHLPDDGLRHELIDGVHYVAPAPLTRHQRVSRELLVALHIYLQRTGLGEVFAAPVDVVLSSEDVVEPDLLIVLGDQSGIVTDKHVRGAPALVIEILSPGTRGRDRGIKRQLYARSGVREYWIVDPDGQTIRVDRREPDGRFGPPSELRASVNDLLTSPLLPDFLLPLREIFGAPR